MDDTDSLDETAAILADAGTLAAIREGQADVAAGQVITREEFLRELHGPAS